MLRASNVRPMISAHSYVHGIHDYNKMPLAPIGCATQCFVSPNQRKSFGAHSIDSWYIGTSPDHYRSNIVLIDETKAERITDTIIFHHRRITNPAVSRADEIVAAASKLTEALKGNIQQDLTTIDIHELERLANIFQEAALKVSETNARQPRVPTNDDTPPRVDPEEEQPNHHTPAAAAARAQEIANAPRVEAGTPRGLQVEYEPRYMTRQQRQLRGSMATDVMLTVMEFTNSSMEPKHN